MKSQKEQRRATKSNEKQQKATKSNKKQQRTSELEKPKRARKNQDEQRRAQKVQMETRLYRLTKDRIEPSNVQGGYRVSPDAVSYLHLRKLACNHKINLLPVGKSSSVY